jgi:hypothetical protein
MQNTSHAELVSASYFIAVENIKTLKQVQGDMVSSRSTEHA